MALPITRRRQASNTAPSLDRRSGAGSAGERCCEPPLVAESLRVTPTELRVAIFQLYGVRQGGAERLARDLGVHHRTVGRWQRGTRQVPGRAELALSLMLELKDQAERPQVSGMTPAELHDSISTLYDDPLVSVRRHRLAVTLGVSPSTLISWLHGRRSINGFSELAIRLLLKKKSLQESSDMPGSNSAGPRHG